MEDDDAEDGDMEDDGMEDSGPVDCQSMKPSCRNHAQLCVFRIQLTHLVANRLSQGEKEKKTFGGNVREVGSASRICLAVESRTMPHLRFLAWQILCFL